MGKLWSSIVFGRWVCGLSLLVAMSTSVAGALVAAGVEISPESPSVVGGKRTTVVVMTNTTAVPKDMTLNLTGSIAIREKISVSIDGAAHNIGAPVLLEAGRSVDALIRQPTDLKFDEDGVNLVVTIAPTPGTPEGGVVPVPLSDRSLLRPAVKSIAATTHHLSDGNVKVPLNNDDCSDIDQSQPATAELVSNDRLLAVKGTCMSDKTATWVQLSFEGAEADGRTYSGPIKLGSTEVDLVIGRGWAWWEVLALVAVSSFLGFGVRYIISYVLVRRKLKHNLKTLCCEWDSDALGCDRKTQACCCNASNSLYKCAVEDMCTSIKEKIDNFKWWKFTTLTKKLEEVRLELKEAAATIKRIPKLDENCGQLILLIDDGQLDGLEAYKALVKREITSPAKKLDDIASRIARCDEADAVVKRWPHEDVRRLIKLDLTGTDPTLHAAVVAFRTAAARAVSVEDITYALGRYDEAVAHVKAFSGVEIASVSTSDKKNLAVTDPSPVTAPPLRERVARILASARTTANLWWIYVILLVMIAAFTALQTLYIDQVFGGYFDFIAAIALGASGGLLGADITAALTAANEAEQEADGVPIYS